MLRQYRQIVLHTLLLLATAVTPVHAQFDLIKVLITTAHMEHEHYRPVADVMTSSLARAFRRQGGMEIVSREEADRMFREGVGTAGVATRYQALEAGEKLGADIVIFSTASKKYEFMVYSITFLEVERDLIQRQLGGQFRATSSPQEIGMAMTREAAQLMKYLPMPEELEDPAASFRDNTVNPDRIPPSFEITELPEVDRYGTMEQIFSYFRVFPGENEMYLLDQQERITRLQARQSGDPGVTELLNQFYIYGDFALRHGMQAYLVKNCTVQGIALLIANGIPVYYQQNMLTGYQGLSPDGDALFKTETGRWIDGYQFTHRSLMAVMFMVPKPGEYRGVSRDYLENAMAQYVNEIGERSELLEVKESILDIDRGGSQ
jgi:hypothetical protein